MTVGTPAEIAATEARVKELQELWLETHNPNSAEKLLAASLLTDNPAADREISRRAQLGSAIKAELSKLEPKLKELKQGTPQEFAKGLAGVLLFAGVFTGVGFALDGLLNTNGAKHLAALGAGYAVLVGVGHGAANTRWRKGK